MYTCRFLARCSEHACDYQNSSFCRCCPLPATSSPFVQKYLVKHIFGPFSMSSSCKVHSHGDTLFSTPCRHGRVFDSPDVLSFPIDKDYSPRSQQAHDHYRRTMLSRSHFLANRLTPLAMCAYACHSRQAPQDAAETSVRLGWYWSRAAYDSEVDLPRGAPLRRQLPSSSPCTVSCMRVQGCGPRRPRLRSRRRSCTACWWLLSERDRRS
jgi:hypothetical protein